MKKISKYRVAFASASAIFLAACSGNVEHRSGAQPVHPGDLVRAASGQTPAVVPVPSVAQSPQNAAVAAQSSAIAAFAAYCEPHIGNLNGAIGAMQGAGFTAVKNIKGPLGDVGTIYTKAGVNYAMWTQKFNRQPAPHTCGVDAPDSPELQRAIEAHMSAKAGAEYLGKNFAGLGLDKTWTSPDALYLAGKSDTPTFGQGTTYSFGLAKQ